MKKLLVVLVLSVMIMTGCNQISALPAPTVNPDLEEVSWETAVDILNSGQVDSLFQLHNLQVTFVLKDGTEIRTIEPNIDAIFQEVDKCGQPCSNIIMATE